MPRRPITFIGSTSIHLLSQLGRFSKFCWDTLVSIKKSGLSLPLLFQQLEFVGVQSFWIIVLAAIMVGAVFGIQFGNIFKLFGAESLIGAAAAFALSKELAPVIGAFLVTGRAGSAMAAEIANMRVNEQIDAMQTMSVNPLAYLCAPRIIASMLMLPLLSSIFVLVGVLSSYFIGCALYEIDSSVFIDKIRWISQPNHILQGLQKSIFFGAIFSSIACFQGYYATGGAKGVGKATTDAVVLALVCILVSDFFISYVQMTALFP